MHKNDRYLLGKYLDSKSVRKGPARAVLKVISVKTLAFQKPYEMLNANTFIEGDEFVAGIGAVTTRTVTNGMRRLREAGLICEFHRQGGDWYYALNLEPLFDFLDQWFSKPLADDATASERARYALWAELLKLKDLFPAMIATVKALAGRVFRDYGRFTTEAKEAMVQAVAVIEQKAEFVVEAAKEVAVAVKEVVMNLADALKSVAKGSKVVADKQRKRAALPLFDAKGKPLSHNGIALWDSLAADFEHLGYEPKHTGKVFGNMKCWLAELTKRGLSEDEIREKMSDIVRRWKYLNIKDQISATSKNNNPYFVKIDPYPNFDTFFAHRNKYTPLLVAANVPTVSLSSKEKENVDFNRHNIF
jgi:DNA-binding transcriptional ArsR family regulator